MALSAADLRGLARLGVDATVGVTDVVEHMHRTIADWALPLGRPRAQRTRGLTGTVYGAIRGTTRLVGRAADAALRRLPADGDEAPRSPKREALLAAINGVWGDHLEASGNPLAIPMSLRRDGRRVRLTADGLKAALPQASGRIAVLAHGLCMNDLQWQRGVHHHGAMLERELGYSVLALHYNSGLHVSDNGARLAALLEALLAHWPRPVDELVVVGHSMGGLVARSACHVAELRRLAWRTRLTRLVCMGTPHHGAVLERGGHLIDIALGLSPYAAPLARLGQARSAGITDLRFGNLQRSDWADRHPHGQRRDDRTPVPLPAGVSVYLLAATTAEQPRGLRHAVIGDGLVTVASAWGEHRDKALALAVPASVGEQRAVVATAAIARGGARRTAQAARSTRRTGLRHPEAADALRHWLS